MLPCFVILTSHVYRCLCFWRGGNLNDMPCLVSQTLKGKKLVVAHIKGCKLAPEGCAPVRFVPSYSDEAIGVSEHRGTLLEGLFKGILFHFGVPLFWEMPIFPSGSWERVPEPNLVQVRRACRSALQQQQRFWATGLRRRQLRRQSTMCGAV